MYPTQGEANGMPQPEPPPIGWDLESPSKDGTSPEPGSGLDKKGPTPAVTGAGLPGGTTPHTIWNEHSPMYKCYCCCGSCCQIHTAFVSICIIEIVIGIIPIGIGISGVMKNPDSAYIALKIVFAIILPIVIMLCCFAVFAAALTSRGIFVIPYIVVDVIIIVALLVAILLHVLAASDSVSPDTIGWSEEYKKTSPKTFLTAVSFLIMLYVILIGFAFWLLFLAMKYRTFLNDKTAAQGRNSPV